MKIHGAYCDLHSMSSGVRYSSPDAHTTPHTPMILRRVTTRLAVASTDRKPMLAKYIEQNYTCSIV